MLLKTDFLLRGSRIHRLLFACGIAVLAACAGQQKQQPQVPPAAGEQPVAQLQQWTIKGKLGVRAPRENGSANLLWEQHSGQNYRIHLSGPLGAGSTEISGDPAGISLKRGSEAPLRASNATELTAQMLGWPLPVAEMYYWVRGLAAPGAAPQHEQRNAQGQLQSLQQAGWQLTFGDYVNAGRYLLPTRIRAQTSQAGGPVAVTLVIKEWLPHN